MTEYFTPDGHLTDAALRGLTEGSLDELHRLEAAEHLSCCDACIDRYMLLLTEAAPEEPGRDLTLPTMRRLHSRQRRETLHRYASAVAAVALTGALWYGGVFDTVGRWMAVELPPPAMSRPARCTQLPGSALLEAADQWLRQLRRPQPPAHRPQPTRPGRIFYDAEK